MSQLKIAAANTVFKLAHLFAQNCALRHGIPDVGGAERIGAVTQVRPEPPIVDITSQIPAAPAATDSPSPMEAVAAVAQGSLWRAAAPFLLTGLGSAGLASGVGYWLWKDNLNPPAVVQPATPSDGSLLQYLEDGGFHREEGEPWTK